MISWDLEMKTYKPPIISVLAYLLSSTLASISLFLMKELLV